MTGYKNIPPIVQALSFKLSGFKSSMGTSKRTTLQVLLFRAQGLDATNCYGGRWMSRLIAFSGGEAIPCGRSVCLRTRTTTISRALALEYSYHMLSRDQYVLDISSDERLQSKTSHLVALAKIFPPVIDLSTQRPRPQQHQPPTQPVPSLIYLVFTSDFTRPVPSSLRLLSVLSWSQ
jgi:hypothetical protein